MRSKKGPLKSVSGKKRALSPDKRAKDAVPSPSDQNPSKRAKMSAAIDKDQFAAYRGDALNFPDFEYDANASESDEAEETSSECSNMDIEDEDKFDDSEFDSDKDQDVFCDSKNEDDEEREEEEEEDEEFDGAPNYMGSFDLYDMHDFSDVYCPNGKSSSIEPEALYEELLSFQAKSKKDARITIPENYAARYDGGASVDKYGSYTLDAGRAGELKQDFIQDPYEGIPYDIIITDIEDVAWEDLKITSMYGRPKRAWNGHGLEGDLEVEGALEGCGTDKASGSIKMRPVWRQVGTDGKPMEFFEGSLVFETSLNPIFARKSRVQRCSKESFDFWAIRAVC